MSRAYATLLQFGSGDVLKNTTFSGLENSAGGWDSGGVKSIAKIILIKDNLIGCNAIAVKAFLWLNIYHRLSKYKLLV